MWKYKVDDYNLLRVSKMSIISSEQIDLSNWIACIWHFLMSWFSICNDWKGLGTAVWLSKDFELSWFDLQEQNRFCFGPWVLSFYFWWHVPTLLLVTTLLVTTLVVTIQLKFLSTVHELKELELKLWTIESKRWFSFRIWVIKDRYKWNVSIRFIKELREAPESRIRAFLRPHNKVIRVNV